MNQEAQRAQDRIKSILAIARNLGIAPKPGQRILDFGCGRGYYTATLREMGLQAYGCDVWMRCDEADAICQRLYRENLFSIVSLDQYRLPYPDAHFDLILSDHVFEHVLDYDSTLREMRRVLRPGGTSLHVFPSRYRLIESHIKIPLAGCFRARPWFGLWHALGRGGDFHTATESFNWVNRRLNYLPKRELIARFRAYFDTVQFVENAAIRAHGHAAFGWLGPLLSTLHVRVVALS
jgi:ubiquinone/menaquinone biosynthesis C-methylase UbiE